MELLRTKHAEVEVLEADLAQCQRKLANYESQLDSERAKLLALSDENGQLKKELQESMVRLLNLPSTYLIF